MDREKHDLSPEEANKYYVAMETMSSISEAVKWDNGKNMVRISADLCVYDVLPLFSISGTSIHGLLES